jgi:hypothetical protein
MLDDDENDVDLDQDELTRYLQASKPTPGYLAFTLLLLNVSSL